MKEQSKGYGQLLSSEEELNNLCRVIRNYVNEWKWEECSRLIPKYMELYPDSAVPHNLMGIVLEMRGRHTDAMKHFRAACALDASYAPANYNMALYSAFEKERSAEPAFDEQDCAQHDKGDITDFFI